MVCSHQVEWAKKFAITDKLVEEFEDGRWGDVQTNRMQMCPKTDPFDTAKKVNGRSGRGFQKGIRKAPPTKYTPTVDCGKSASTSEGTAAKKTASTVKRAAGVWDAASGSDSWRAAPSSRMLISNEDATSMIKWLDKSSV